MLATSSSWPQLTKTSPHPRNLIIKEHPLKRLVLILYSNSVHCLVTTLSWVKLTRSGSLSDQKAKLPLQWGQHVPPLLQQRPRTTTSAAATAAAAKYQWTEWQTDDLIRISNQPQLHCPRRGRTSPCRLETKNGQKNSQMRGRIHISFSLPSTSACHLSSTQFCCCPGQFVIYVPWKDYFGKQFSVQWTQLLYLVNCPIFTVLIHTYIRKFKTYIYACKRQHVYAKKEYVRCRQEVTTVIKTWPHLDQVVDWMLWKCPIGRCCMYGSQLNSLFNNAQIKHWKNNHPSSGTEAFICIHASKTICDPATR